MQSLIPILQFGGAFTAFTMAIAIFLVARKQNASDALLGWILLLISIVLLRTGISVGGLLIHYPHQLGVLFPLTYLIGPLLLFYSRARQLDQPFRLRHFWPHFLPALASFVLLIPVYLLPVERKIDYITLTRQPDLILRVFESFPLSSALNLLQLFVVWVVVAGYALLAWKTVSSANADKPDPAKILSGHWISFLSIGLMAASIIAVTSLLATLVFGVVFLSPLLMLSYLSFVVIAGYSAVQLVLRPNILYAEHGHTSANDTATPPPNIAVGEKYAFSGLTHDAAIAFAEKLKQAMNHERLYRQPDLSLQQLADRLGCSAKHLSQILNEEINENFYEFVNRYRIEDIKRQLEKGALKESPIIDIALNAGFNSKPSFYNAFKKHTGTTPTQYVNQHDAQSSANLL